MRLLYLGRWSYGRFQNDNNIFYKMKNDLTTGTWQDNIWCPIIIILFCTSDEVKMSILVGIRAIGMAASMPNWSLCHVIQATTSLGNDVWWRRQQNRRNKTRRQVFLLYRTLRINQSWWLPLSYGHHGAPLPAFKHTTISKHTMEQVYVVKTRKNYH